MRAGEVLVIAADRVAPKAPFAVAGGLAAAEVSVAFTGLGSVVTCIAVSRSYSCTPLANACESKEQRRGTQCQ
ncbi:MAG: hypothetical protein LAO56_08185 [Acidobacteriia bacterium]|nr:hypothetical protein [Terriglobia bacterium]